MLLLLYRNQKRACSKSKRVLILFQTDWIPPFFSFCRLRKMYYRVLFCNIQKFTCYFHVKRQLRESIKAAFWFFFHILLQFSFWFRSSPLQKQQQLSCEMRRAGLLPNSVIFLFFFTATLLGQKYIFPFSKLERLKTKGYAAGAFHIGSKLILKVQKV